jgi:hypothetical protein
MAGSDRGRHDGLMRVLGYGVFLSIGLMTAPAFAQAPDMTCFNPAETRERIHADRLAEPFQVVRTTAGALHAEALGARLCRTEGTLVYQINLLGRDGRVIRATVDAVTGVQKTHGRP